MDTVKVKNLELGAGVPKVVVPINGRTKDEILAQAKVIADIPADLAEWRADFYEDLTSIPALFMTLSELRGVLGDMPIIFTIRTKPEGGEVELDFDMYSMLNLAAAQSKCVDLVDIQIFWDNIGWRSSSVDSRALNLANKIHDSGCLVISSRNNASGTPDSGDFYYNFTSQQRDGIDITKVAVTPQSKKDVAILISAAIEFTEKADRPFITQALGSFGFMNSAASELSGSCMAYATPEQAPMLKDILTSINTVQAGE